MNPKKFNILIVLCLTSILSFSNIQASDLVIRITGIPDENPTELQRKFQPMVDFLEKKLGKKVNYIPVIDYGAAVAALAANKVDFAWLGGFTHVQARRLTGATPVVMRAIDRQFKSVFIAHYRSGVESPADLKNKTFSYGSKSSTSGHLMPRYFLNTEFSIDSRQDFLGKPVFSGAHDATVKMVESGKVMAGALNAEVWKRLVNNKKVDLNKVRVIWTTPDYVDYVWTARKGLDPNIIEKFRTAFLSLDNNKPSDSEILSLQGAKKFVAATESDFDTIESVGISTGLLKNNRRFVTN